MHKIKQVLQNTVLYAMAVVLVGGMPMVAFAEENPETYTYDAASGRWISNKWVYDSATNVYVPAVPEGATKPTPEPAAEVSDEDAPADTKQVAGGDAVVDEDINGSANTAIDNNNTIQHGLNSNAGTGNAGVKSNTKAGDALSGDANADTTIINSIHTTVDGETEGVARFTTNIYGDVMGDITIGPSIANAQVDRDVNLNSETDINNNNAITNDVKIKATSGDAEVAQNTEAGNAKSGDANAVANVLNLINTIIGANKSFIGTINIYGNLNGDILISPDFIPQLLADNSIEKLEIDMPLSMHVNDDSSIVNNVDLTATTGDATVKDNTGAGSATTGSANTKLTVLNLTGRKVNAKNSLLVFVNVLGKWVGMIVDAPNATAAAIGNGVVSNTVNVSDDTNITNKSKIINNLDLSAESGDASVTQNTKAGDAESGNATASANIANIESTELQLTDWFGVLFINVFGTWIGSFGVDTEAGTVIPLASAAVATQAPAATNAPNLRFGFRPSTTSATTVQNPTSVESDAMSETMAAANAYLASVPNAPNSVRPVASPREDPFSAVMMVGGFMAAGVSSAWVGIRRKLDERRMLRKNETGLTIHRK